MAIPFSALGYPVGVSGSVLGRILPYYLASAGLLARQTTVRARVSNFHSAHEMLPKLLHDLICGKVMK